MPRILFINRVYWPNEAATAQLLHDLVGELSARQVPITVITSGSSARAPADDPQAEGVRIVRCHPSRPGKRGVLARLLDYGGFLWAARRTVAREANPGDLVVAMTDPPLLAAFVSPVALRRGARMWHWCQDLHPEVAIAIAPSRLLQWALKAFLPPRNRALRTAVGVVALGADMQRRLELAGVKPSQIHLLPNWAPLGVANGSGAKIRARWGLEDHFVIVYSGNLGRAHSLLPILTVATALADDPRIQFIFIGLGAQLAELQKRTQSQRLTNVHFHPPVPRSELADALAAADLHLVTMRPGCEGTVWPSKFYGIIAAHRPVLFIGPPPAEIFSLIKNEAVGRSFETAETEAIATFLRELSASPRQCQTFRDNAARLSDRLVGPAQHAEFWERHLSESCEELAIP